MKDTRLEKSTNAWQMYFLMKQSWTVFEPLLPQILEL